MVESKKGKLVLRMKSPNRIELVMRGEDHTIANLLVKLAIRKPHVTYAAYRIEHPLVGDSIVIIATDGKRDPLDVVNEVIGEVMKLVDEFVEKLRSAGGAEQS